MVGDTEKILLAALVIGLLAIAAYSVAQKNAINVFTQAQPEKRVIDVQGSFSASVEPNQVELIAGFENEASTAQEAQQKNAQVMQAIRQALFAKGLSKGGIETSFFSVEVVREYDEKNRRSFVTGFKAIHLIKVKSKEVSRAGEFIDAIVGAGANRVDSIAFTLSEEKQGEWRKTALEKAGLNAREKAQAIAGSLGVRIVALNRASEQFFEVTPFKRFVAAEALPAQTEIAPGQVEVRGSLSASYEVS